METPSPEDSVSSPAPVWAHLTSAYLRARFVIAVVAAVASLVGGFATGWARGPWVVLISIVVAAHGYVISSRASSQVTSVLVLDACTLAAVSAVLGVPTIAIANLAFLMIVASVLEKGRRVYVLWAVDVTLMGLALAVSSLLPIQRYTPVQREISGIIGMLFLLWSAVALTRTLAPRLRAADATRRAAEAELEARKRRFRALLELNSDAIAVTDVRLKIVELGVQNHRLIGYEEEERLGRSILDLVESDDRSNLVMAYRAVMEDPSTPAFFDFRIKRKDGEVRDMAGAVRNLLHDPDLQGLVFNCRDVTEQRAANSELEQANARLARSVQSRDEFVASVSHELRTPLTAVVGLAEILSTEVDVEAAERNEMLRILASQARQTSAIVDDLLVVARADIGQVSVSVARCDLADIVAQALETVGTELQLTVDVDAGTQVLADPNRLLQIVRNLVSNADRHGGRRVSITSNESDQRVMLEVADDGPGVPDEDVDRIFEPYERSEAASARHGSIGLGLSVSRILAGLMDGDVVYRRRGDWTVFELSLPGLSESDDVAVAETTAAARQA